MSRLITGIRPDQGSARCKVGEQLLKEVRQLDQMEQHLLLLGWTNGEVSKAILQAHKQVNMRGGSTRFIHEMDEICKRAEQGERPFKKGETR
uniref:Uncharacterized protein n=1 Tax=viral metagenome TaxID=1070528 RepID=A0A6H1Z909_9ZZZZ